mmetsp:Transcript_10106/g.18409  ORF Transcript_10106/g.18409 Transcript_10106/m.18409 type:complete len:683 (-) Transcript_10106:187-2235(-)
MPSSAMRNRSRSPGAAMRRNSSIGKSSAAVRRNSGGKNRRNRSIEDVDKIINELMMSNPRLQQEQRMEERREEKKGSQQSLENLEVSIPNINFHHEDNSQLSEGGVSSSHEKLKKKKKKKKRKKRRDPEAIVKNDVEDSVQTEWTNPQGPTMPHSQHRYNYDQQLPTQYSPVEAHPPQQEQVQFTPKESMKMQGIVNFMAASQSRLHYEPEVPSPSQNDQQSKVSWGNIGNTSQKHKPMLQSQWSDHQIAELKSLLLPELKQELGEKKPTEQTKANINKLKNAAKTVMTLQEAAYAIYNKGDGDSDDGDSSEARGGKSIMQEFIDQEDDEHFSELSEDVFSFMYMSPIKSPAFVYGVLVFSFQVLVLALIMSDLLDISSENPTGIPPGVSSPVTCAQFLALLIVVATQDDMITSLIGILDGYDAAILKIEPSALMWKFFVSNGCRLGGGLLYLTVSFFLIIQSTNILGLFLNLAALNFISTLDDVAFSIARNGFISDRLEKLAVIIADLPIPVARSVSNLWRRGFFVVVFGCLVTGWGLAVKRQRMGMFQCQSMSVTFGSSAPTSLAELSGTYDRTSTLRNLRAVFESTNVTNKLSFCLNEGSWTFSKVVPDESVSFDPCRNVTAFMPEDDTYDISEVASSQHFVWMQNDPLDDRNVFDTDGISLHHFKVKCLVNPGAVYIT